MLASVEINNSTASVSGNCHLVLQNAQANCLGLSVEIINNELWLLEGVKTILTPDRRLSHDQGCFFDLGHVMRV